MTKPDNEKLVEQLMAEDADVTSQNGFGALHYAMTLPDNFELVKKLIGRGADVNKQNLSGYTALHFASNWKDEKIVRVFKEAGADVNKRNIYGETALHSAASLAENLIVQELIEAGVDINCQDNFGNTALFYSLNGRITNVNVRILDKAGNDAKKQSNDKQTVGDVIQKHFFGRVEANRPDNLRGHSLRNTLDGTSNFVNTEVLISSGANVNIKNTYGLDPLQSIASTSAMLNVLKLHKHLGLYRDVFGNTIFHFVMNMARDEHIWSYIRAHQIDFVKYLSIQNMFGQTPLHYAKRELELIFDNFDSYEFDMFIVDEDGDTFFHKYCSLGRNLYVNLETRDDIFLKRLLRGEYKICPREKVAKLLEFKNKTGHTPLDISLKNVVKYHDVTDLLKLFLSAGAKINSTNSFGESVLHRLIPHNNFMNKSTETGLQNGADVNLQNIFGESPLFMINYQSRDSMKLVLRYEAEIDICNKVGQTPLLLQLPDLNGMFNYGINTFENIVDINKKDCYGSNLLHYIAWSSKADLETLQVNKSFRDYITDILKSKNLFVVQDSLGQLPCDVAYLRGHTGVLKTLCVCKNGFHKKQVVFSSRKIPFKSLKLKGSIYQNSVKVNCKYFTDCAIRDIMDIPFIGLVHFDGEAQAVKAAVKCIVEDICRRIGERDELLTNTVILSGSVAENTKVGLPNEFDFLCMLEKLSDLFFIEESADNNCVQIKLKEEHRGSTCDRFFARDYDFYLWQGSLLDRFHTLLKEIIQLGDIYRHLNIFFVKGGLKRSNRSPNFKFSLKWSGCLYKNMIIDIDLVPACQIECPKTLKLTLEAFDRNAIANEGLLVLFQNTQVDFMSVQRQAFKQARILAVNTERKHLATMSQEAKDAYVIVKILCEDRICPTVIDVKDTCGHVRGNNCSSIITSYMLKNCLFQVVAEIQSELSSQITAYEYACSIFKKIHQCAIQGNLPCYMFPWQNLFNVRSVPEENTGFRYFTCISCNTKRAMYAKLILTILGEEEDFSDINLETNDPYKMHVDAFGEDSRSAVSNIRQSEFTQDANNICANCKRTPDKHIRLYPCFRCKLWTYCSETCREENWKLHRLACDYHH